MIKRLFHRQFIWIPVVVMFFLVFPGNSHASSVAIELEIFTTGLSQPISLTHAGDSRLFVVEQAGLIKILESSGSVKPLPFLDITDRVNSAGNEQGLLGLAFHPDYSTNGYFFVNYTDLTGDTVVSRFSVAADPDLADSSSEVLLLSFSQPFANHNGGDIAFGPDGFLYIAIGDGGSAGDPQNNGQNPATFLGKILRIDVDSGSPYGIPVDNPFVGVSGTLDEIWALGLRNPWRISFDRSSGDLWIADVGQDVGEEINHQLSVSTGGENYGWRCYEGTSPFNSTGCDTPGNYKFPVFEYLHSPHCSVTGGYVYRGTEYPDLDGHYIFADYCSGHFWSLKWDGSSVYDVTEFGVLQTAVSTFGENIDGELYAAGRNTGTVYRIRQTEQVVPSLSMSGLILMLIFIGAILKTKQ